tara:strand:+ start:678 stop:2003 length:1326 start_codon:yes stop_codon:yes gene_type:complete
MKLLSKSLEWINPEIFVNHLANDWGTKGLIWLDGDGSNLGGKVTIGVNPVKQIICEGLPNDPKSQNPFKYLRELGPGHWSGWLSYEAGAWTEPNTSWKRGCMAILWIASHDPIFKFDIVKKEFVIEGTNKANFDTMKNWLKNIDNSKVSIKNKVNPKQINIPLKSWEWVADLNVFANHVNFIKKLIESGDIFQANLSTLCKTFVDEDTSALSLYLKLRKHCPAPFSGLIIRNNIPNDEAIISSSPERFLKVTNEGKVETRPIKGTRPRSSYPEEDARLATDLICSSKDRAENIMIVDLLRNDLGKVCKPGSISTTKLVGLESFKNVHHLTSVIRGSLQEGKSWVDLLEACWPGGSITGAPKIRACRRIYDLESHARGPYCGSIIKIDWDGSFDSNILIRTMTLKDKLLEVHGGCGIVADSNPTEEAKELRWKLLPLLKALA